MKKLLLVAVLASTLVLTGCSWTKKPTSEPMMKKDDAMMQQDTMKKDDSMMGTGTTGERTKEQMEAMEKESMMKKDQMMKDEMMKVEPASYIPFNELTAKSLLASGKHVVLFFHAGRCPTCKALDTELTTKLSTLPANSVVLKVDYDNSSDLKKKYGVTSQHTLVRVDKDMNVVAKQTGGDVESIKVLLQ